MASTLINPETMRAHRARWFAYSGPYGEKLPCKSGQRLYGIGYDVTCSCGWETRTGGATRKSVENDLWDHRFSAQTEAEVMAEFGCRRCSAAAGAPCRDGNRVLNYLHPERYEDSLQRTAEEDRSGRPERFPSRGLPCPDEGCQFRVCAECSRAGRTRHHFNLLGLCPDGHRLEEGA